MVAHSLCRYSGTRFLYALLHETHSPFHLMRLKQVLDSSQSIAHGSPPYRDTAVGRSV
jgi:hypothetical protein